MIKPDVPLISCIMPTRNRHDFVTQAIRYFMAQDYPNKELVIVDASDSRSPDLEYLRADIRYVWLSRPLTIGMMRNVAVSLSQGGYICHFDDDDYFGPQRLSKQIRPIQQGRADITALHMSLLLDINTGLWACPDYTHAKLFSYDVRAGTLLYPARSWHGTASYENVSRGEDVQFLSGLINHDSLRLERVVSPSSYICVRHGANVTDGLDTTSWPAVPKDQYIPKEYQAFYASLRMSEVQV